MESYFYCQNCDHKITIEALAFLEEGKCMVCGSMEGFSTAPKSDNDPFEKATILNDTDFLE